MNLHEIMSVYNTLHLTGIFSALDLPISELPIYIHIIIPKYELFSLWFLW